MSEMRRNKHGWTEPPGRVRDWRVRHPFLAVTLPSLRMLCIRGITLSFQILPETCLRFVLAQTQPLCVCLLPSSQIPGQYPRVIAGTIMSKKKGLSLEEKRDKILEVFHESKEVFILKEVEKKAAAKGVVLQSVKDVLQTLVDDDLVHQEKIGTTNFFWSFPSEAGVKLQQELGRLQARGEELRAQAERARESIRAEGQGKEDSEERRRLVQDLETLRAEHASLRAQLQALAESDPEAVDAMREATRVARDAANRWTDNIWCLASWCKRKFQGREKELEKFFEQNGITDALDYVE